MSEQTASMFSNGEAIVANFLEAVRSQVTDLHNRSWEEIKDAIFVRMETLADQNAERALDDLSQQWVIFCSFLLAAYQELQPHVGDAEQVLSILRNAMAMIMKDRITLVDRFGISEDAPEDAFARIAENFKRRGEEQYGKGWKFVQDVQDEMHSFINIEKCFFNDFFRANGKPEITPIFCAMDLLWIDELKQPCYGVSFDRPTTLAQGDDMCRFQFTKSASKQ